MEEIQKHNQSEDKKVWLTPDLELIDIQSGTVPGGPEGILTTGNVNKHDGAS